MVTFDPSADFASIVDGLQAVTLDPRTGADVSIQHALRRAITRREVGQSNGYYTSSDVRWHLPVEECATEPKPGDVIVEGSTRWTVMEVERATFSTRWSCLCRNVAVVYSLDATVDLLKATYAKGEGGATEPTWVVVESDLGARIQPVSWESGVENDARRTAERFQVFIASALTLDAGGVYRLRDQDGRLFSVLSMTGSERIGELQTIDAEAVLWPRS